MENVIYNELRMRGYSVDVGVIPIAERNQKVRLSVNSWKLILYAIFVLPDTISSLHTRCQMKRNELRKSDRSEKLMILSKRLLLQKILYSPIMMTMVS